MYRAYLLDVPINKVVVTSIAVMFTVTQVLKYLAEKKFVANEHWKYKKNNYWFQNRDFTKLILTKHIIIPGKNVINTSFISLWLNVISILIILSSE